MCSQVRSAGIFLGGANNLRDLHVKRRHRGRLVDVASLGMSVVDRHRRVEGGEELWCSWKREKRKEIQFVRLLLKKKTIVT